MTPLQTILSRLSRGLRTLIDPPTPPGPMTGSPGLGTGPELFDNYTPLQIPEHRRAIANSETDALNLEDNLTEQQLLGLQDELLDVIRERFHAEGQYLVCNRCGMTVTWITRHCVERHGDNMRVWRLPATMKGGQLW